MKTARIRNQWLPRHEHFLCWASLLYTTIFFWKIFFILKKVPNTGKSGAQHARGSEQPATCISEIRRTIFRAAKFEYFQSVQLITSFVGPKKKREEWVSLFVFFFFFEIFLFKQHQKKVVFQCIYFYENIHFTKHGK